MKQLIIIICALISLQVLAQEPEYKKITFDSLNTKNRITKKERDEYQAITLKEQVVLEYVVENDIVSMYYTVHRKSVVLNDKGVEYFNRVYIPTSNTIDIVNIKARAITESGKVVDFDTTNLKEVENLENKGAYKIFAIEGIEKGSTIELLYTLKNAVSSNGKYTFQEEFPVLNASYTIISPDFLVFNVKGYNTTFNKIDTVLNNKHYLTLKTDSIAALRDEKYCTYKANLAKIEYSFSHNKNSSTTSTSTWATAAKALYDAFYQEDEKNDKQISKLLAKMKLSNLAEIDKIKTIENYLKDNYELKPIRGIDGLESIEFALKNKFTNEEGFTRLFCKCLSIAGINHQLGCTSNRNECRFDKDFMTWQYLYEYVIYFPNIDKYMSPTSIQYRLGMIPDDITNNDALFLKMIKVGTLVSALPEIKTIPNTPYEKSATNQIAMIELNPTDLVTKVHYRHELSGYEANYIQPFYDFLPEDKKKEVIESMLKLMNEDTKIVDFKVENTDHNISPFDKSFNIDGNLEVKNLIEKAGDNIIFKLGEVIGLQEEMYDEHKRDNPVELQFAHYYMRDLRVKIPEGYTLKGTENLIMNIICKNGAAGFTSSYKIENNILIVSVKEYYRDVNVSIDQYEDFRKVINAAADFNKLSVVFQKM